MSKKIPFTATAIWLRTADSEHVEVYVEIDGKWRRVIRDFLPHDGEVSHISEGSNAKKWPLDKVTEAGNA